MHETSSSSPEDARRFRGLFKPPGIGNYHMPIGIAGRGTLEVTPEALVARGYKQGDRSGLMVLMFFAFFAAGIAIMVLASIFDLLDDYGLVEAAAFAVMGAGAAAFARLGLKRRKENDREPTELRIPWEKIRRIESGARHEGEAELGLEIHQEVRILVAKHRPRGVIHFYPDDGPEVLIDALNAARAPR